MNRRNRESGTVSVALSGTTALIHRPSAAGQGLVAALVILALVTTSALANFGVRDVTFSVDMSVQVALGRFDPEAGHSVNAYIVSWYSPQIISLNREGTGMVYSATTSVLGPEGDPIDFSFRGVLPGGTLSEQAGHWALLGPVGESQVLPTPYFSNVGPDDVVCEGKGVCL